MTDNSVVTLHISVGHTAQDSSVVLDTLYRRWALHTVLYQSLPSAWCWLSQRYKLPMTSQRVMRTSSTGSATQSLIRSTFWTLWRWTLCAAPDGVSNDLTAMDSRMTSPPNTVGSCRWLLTRVRHSNVMRAGQSHLSSRLPGRTERLKVGFSRCGQWIKSCPANVGLSLVSLISASYAPTSAVKQAPLDISNFLYQEGIPSMSAATVCFWFKQEPLLDQQQLKDAKVLFTLESGR